MSELEQTFWVDMIAGSYGSKPLPPSPPEPAQTEFECEIGQRQNDVEQTAQLSQRQAQPDWERTFFLAHHAG